MKLRIVFLLAAVFGLCSLGAAFAAALPAFTL